eukprot:927677-Amphidinium_carterae.1
MDSLSLEFGRLSSAFEQKLELTRNPVAIDAQLWLCLHVLRYLLSSAAKLGRQEPNSLPIAVARFAHGSGSILANATPAVPGRHTSGCSNLGPPEPPQEIESSKMCETTYF